jgi:pimeloyl-ACP methyl ester carboxylesterase
VLPGHDDAGRVAEPTIDAYARQVFGVLDHAGVARAVVAGVSMGGYIAFAMLRQAPGRFAGLVLADTRSTADNDEGRALRRRTTTRARRPDVVATVRRLIEAQPAEGVADAARAMMTRPDSTPLLPTIDVPTLIIVGEEDVITPPEDAERMHAAIPGASVVRIPEAGHLSNLEDPARFDEALIRFMSRIAPERS